MVTPNFSDLSEDARLVVLRASLGMISPASLDLSLLPEGEVLMQLMRHQKTYLGENFKTYLLATLAKVAEEVIANMEHCIAEGYPEAALRCSKHRDPRIRPEGIFSLLDEDLQKLYGVKPGAWIVFRTQIDGFAPDPAQFEESLLFEERNRRWLACWLVIERAGAWHPREGKQGVEAWLRKAADPFAHSGSYKTLYAPTAQRILGEHSCPRCGQSVPESLHDEHTGWDCCDTCHDQLDRKGHGWDWCSTCCVDTNWSQDVICQCL